MLNKRIIYQEPERAAAIITPLECGLTLQEIAAKDVPSGVAYWIIEQYDVDNLYLQSGTVRDAWTVSETSMGRAPDGVGE
jgi:hypothetical protein